MSRSLFQKPRAIGPRYFLRDERSTAHSYDLDFEQRTASRQSLFSRLPLVVKLIIWQISAAVGIIIAFIAWLIIGALTLP